MCQHFDVYLILCTWTLLSKRLSQYKHLNTLSSFLDILFRTLLKTVQKPCRHVLNTGALKVHTSEVCT